MTFNQEGFIKFYRCGYYDCLQEFESESHLEEHLHKCHTALFSLQTNFEDNSNQGKMSKSKDQPVISQITTGILGCSNVQSCLISTQNDMTSSQFKKMAQCLDCGKFFNKNYLEAHKRKHTGSKPFICNIPGCNRSFTQSSSRNVHQKRVHSIGTANNSENEQNNNQSNHSGIQGSFVISQQTHNVLHNKPRKIKRERTQHVCTQCGKCSKRLNSFNFLFVLNIRQDVSTKNSFKATCHRSWRQKFPLFLR